MNLQKIRFYREDSRWFSDVPTWEGTKEDLEMVFGADVLLDLISEGEEEVSIEFGEERFPGSDQIIFLSPQGDGARYHLPSYRGKDYEMNFWICSVTKFVFGSYPDSLWMRKVL
jgi:hypothetical protein